MINSIKCTYTLLFTQFVHHLHIINGHPGILPTILTLEQNIKINKNKKRIIKNLIKYCHLCQTCKNNHRIYGKINGKVITTEPLKHISTDIYGLIDAYNYKHNKNTNKFFIITFTDRCTRFTRIRFLSKISSKKYTKGTKRRMVEKFFLKPSTILSDNGRCYNSKSSKLFLKSLNIKQILTSPFNPTCNLISERLNQSISDLLKIYKNWDIKTIKLIIANKLNEVVKVSTKQNLVI
ncbi:Transposon Tf2-8 polyprotein [Dictyocoela muelleri]|nr:Transposon Tf2-8 polyprotein [Dictyocoela muelleri]